MTTTDASDVLGDVLGVVAEAIDLQHLVTSVSSETCGAVATFLGTVRSPNAGQAVRYIDYEGYEAMILAQLHEICGLLRTRHAIGRIALVHRLGRLTPGEVSIAIVVVSAHRRPALEACGEALELCKQRLPIWKFEVTDAGGAFVEGRSDAAATL